MISISVKNKTIRQFLIAALLCIFSIPQASAGGDLSLLLSLKGNWQFSIGINSEWASPKYDDSQWESIKVPSSWEDQGFNGYNGYAFYRKKVNISSTLKGRMLYLYLGYIDDVDEAYFNGHKIGSTGGFPPHYSTAYNAERVYYIPEQFINFDGVNVIAVKVYDTEQAGGIVGGEIGVYGGKTAMKMDVNLQTSWKFKTGDDLNRRNPAFDDSKWSEIMVPAKWEDQGYRDYDGYAWYRKTFTYQGTGEDDRMVLLLGKIDDVDQVYINGTLVGSTGSFPGNDRGYSGTAYNAFRGYYLPAGLLKKGQKVVIAVRVLDTGGEGGIYDGPVGMLTQTRYIEYWRTIKKTRH
jgi:sialate O-acetylesterase